MISAALNAAIPGVRFSAEAEQTVRLFMSKKSPLPGPREFLKMLASRRETRPVEDHALVAAGWVAAGGDLNEMVEAAKSARSYSAKHPEDVEAKGVGDVLSWYKREVADKRDINGFAKVAEAAEKRAAQIKAELKTGRRF